MDQAIRDYNFDAVAEILEVIKKLPSSTSLSQDYSSSIMEKGCNLIHQAIRDQNFDAAEKILQFMKELPSSISLPKE